MENRDRNLLTAKGKTKNKDLEMKNAGDLHNPRKRDIVKMDDVWNELRRVSGRFSLPEDNIALLELACCNLEPTDFTYYEENIDDQENIENENSMEIEAQHETEEFSADDQLFTFLLTLYYYSPSAYEHIRSTFNTRLPPSSIIKKQFEKKGGDPGFTAEAFAAIARKAEKKEIIANVTLMQKQITKSDSIDIGTGLDLDCEYARGVLIVMVTALNSDWKIPVGYFFDDVREPSKAEFIKICIERLYEIGVKCVSVSIDADSAKVIEQLGASFENPVFSHPVTKNSVICFVDPGDVLLRLKLGLAQSHSLTDRNGHTSHWKYLAHLEKLQKGDLLEYNEFFDRIEKKRAVHVYDKPQLAFKEEKMKAKPATDVFNSYVADALDRAREMREINIMGEVPDHQFPQLLGSETTAEFVRTVSNLFDIFTSQVKHDE